MDIESIKRDKMDLNRIVERLKITWPLSVILFIDQLSDELIKYRIQALHVNTWQALRKDKVHVNPIY